MAKSTVTLADIYMVVNRLEDKLDERVSNIEDRISVMENFQSKILGVGVAISTILGIVGSWFWNKIVGKT